MDIRQMAIIDNTTNEITAIPIEAYRLGEDKLNFVVSLLDKLITDEFWSPVFQAWEPFLDTYLSSGVNAELASKYYGTFVEKRDYLQIKPGVGSDIFADILKLKRSSDPMLFDGLFYQDISNFCDVQCKFFVGNQKTLVKQIYSEDINVQTLNDLMDMKTWRSMMCAIVFWRHCQVSNINWSKIKAFSQLHSRLAEWVDIYQKTFDQIVDFIGESQKYYDWYQPRVKEVVCNMWSTSLILSGRPVVLTNKDIYAVSPKIANRLVAYVNNSPSYFDDPFSEQTVWDSMSALFYPKNPQDPKFAEIGYKALCVPRGYFKRMCDTLYQFYWLVKDGGMTSQLYLRKQLHYEKSGKGSTPEEFLDDLYTRGFPVIEEGI